MAQILLGEVADQRRFTQPFIMIADPQENVLFPLVRGISWFCRNEKKICRWWSLHAARLGGGTVRDVEAESVPSRLLRALPLPRIPRLGGG